MPVIDELLIQACKRRDRQAQHRLYEHLSPKLFITCRRYLRQNEDVEEVLADAVLQVLTQLHQLRESAALEGWARKITVNLCLKKLKQKVNFHLHIDDLPHNEAPTIPLRAPAAETDLLALLHYLPEGGRTVFNLFAIEGFSHAEIAAMLGISEGTSKSQLNYARKKLQDLVNRFYYQTPKTSQL